MVKGWGEYNEGTHFTPRYIKYTKGTKSWTWRQVYRGFAKVHMHYKPVLKHVFIIHMQLANPISEEEPIPMCVLPWKLVFH